MEDNPWPSAFATYQYPPTTSIFVPSADFKATILNKVLFPIKPAKPLIPLSQQLSKQNTKGISEEHKKG
jgi:hypothetical protein